MKNHDRYVWLIAALLREMSWLEEKVIVDCMNSSFTFNRCFRQESVEAPRLWKMVRHLLANVKEEWGRQEEASSCTSMKEHVRYAASCEPTTSGSCPTPRATMNRC